MSKIAANPALGRAIQDGLRNRWSPEQIVRRLRRKHPDYPGEPTTTGAVKIAFMVFELDSLVAWLAENGVEVAYPPVSFGAGSRITAVRDPDGNLVELTELGLGWLDHLRAHRADGGDLVTYWAGRTPADPA